MSFLAALSCSCLLACVLALCYLVDTNVLLYDMYFVALVHDRLQAVPLCLWFVYTVAFVACFVPSLRGARRRSRFEKKKGKKRG